MDVLSEIVKAVRVDGALFFNGEFSAPWCFRSREATQVAPYLAPEAEHVIIFHLLREGCASAWLQDGPRVELRAGDIVVFPHGDAHFLGNGSPERPVDSFTTFAKNLTQGLKVAQYGGGGEITRFVCGYLACDPRLSEVVLAALPKMLRVHVDGAAGEWLEKSIRYSVGETAEGDNPVIAKLSEVLFAETLRRYIGSLPENQTGWLAGARDPIIGRALALMHSDPAEEWTIEMLARRVGSSRTRLAERFRHFLGDSPMAYLAQLRLTLGADKLQSTNDSVAQIAAEVGYGSEAAFNRAFKREFTDPPARFRRRRSARAA